MTGAEFVVSFLQSHGVDELFCYPGVAVLELFDELGKSDINHILVRHEQGAVFAASGYARASGRVGVCIATSGPGAVNLTTGITDANLDSVPLLVITGQVESGSIGRDAFQEADIMGITLPVTKHNYLIKKSSQLCSALEEAWNIASKGRCGPVLVDITKDVLASELENTSASGDAVLPRSRKNSYPLEDALPEIKKAIEESYRPVILAGGGVVSAGASEALSGFAALTGIPVISTLMGMGTVTGKDVNMYGMTGIYGGSAAKTALGQCDLCIAVGCRFSDRTIADFSDFGKRRMIIHCDIDPAEINKNLSADIAVVEDAKRFFLVLTDYMRSNCDIHRDAFELWNTQLRHEKSKHEIVRHETRLSNWEILRTIDQLEAVRRDAIYVSDVGDFQMSAARELEPRYERGFITSGGLGAMGFGLPAAIGASYSAPDGVKNIILLCGDGGFQMSVQELSTLKKAKLPVKIFVFDNSALRMIKNKQDRYYEGRHTDSVFTENPDFELIGKAYGINTVCCGVKERDRLAEIFNEVLDSRENVIVICKV